MKTLNELEVQQISGAVLHVDGYYVYVPSTGIPDNYYYQIDSVYDQIFNNKIDMYQGAVMLINVPSQYLDTYSNNINNAIII